MKKTAKSLLVTALILFAAGVLLTLGSFLFVKIAGIDPFGIPAAQKMIADKTVLLDEILANSPDSNYVKKLTENEFSRIDITNFAGDIKIVGGAEETKLDLYHANVNNLSYKVVGETLVISEVDPVSFFGIIISQDGMTYKGLRQIFGPGNKANTGKVITLYLSDDVKVNQIDLDSQIGDITLTNLDTKIVNLKAKWGKISVSDHRASDAKLTLSGDICSVALNRNLYASSNVSVKFGSIKSIQPGGYAQNTVLDTWVGNVSIETDEAISEYKIGFSTMFGKITNNGEPCGKKLDLSSSTSSRISSSVLLGRITISHGINPAPQPEPEEAPTVEDGEAETNEEAEEIATTE